MKTICKIAGAVCLFTAAAGAGAGMAVRIRQREHLLDLLLRMLILLKSQLMYGNQSLFQAFEEIALRMEGYPGELAGRIAGRLERMQGSLPVIFEESLRECRDSVWLPQEAVQEICLLGAGLGNVDLSIQIRQIEWCQKNIQELLGRLRKDAEEKKKIYLSLGLAGGFWMLLLIW